ncbi:hypothetical protein F4780DRAFT_718286, partial [Xylariomycetidae sp. FL0641]
MAPWRIPAPPALTRDTYMRQTLPRDSITRWLSRITLPLLQQAASLHRIVTVFAGTKESTLSADDFQGRNLGMVSLRYHCASM